VKTVLFSPVFAYNTVYSIQPPHPQTRTGKTERLLGIRTVGKDVVLLAVTTKEKRFGALCNTMLQRLAAAVHDVKIAKKEIIMFSMKKSEKIITALVVMLLGILLLMMKDNFIGIIMTLAGLCFIVLGIVDVLGQNVATASLKIVCGIFVAISGWLLVQAVLYIVAAVVLAIGALFLYHLLKDMGWDYDWLSVIGEYAVPILCILIGVLLFFHEKAGGGILIVCGILTILMGAFILFNAFWEDNC
jgi:hypothetical protein